MLGISCTVQGAYISDNSQQRVNSAQEAGEAADRSLKLVWKENSVSKETFTCNINV
jgi:hypothetical protein